MTSSWALCGRPVRAVQLGQNSMNREKCRIRTFRHRGHMPKKAPHLLIACMEKCMKANALKELEE